MTDPKKDGITLIALIITIIVMLILVAVAVRVAVDSNLFGHARNAAQGWKTAEDQEANIGNDNQINDIVNKYKGDVEEPGDDPVIPPDEPIFTTDRTVLKIGDYIDYTPDTTGNYMGLGNSTTEKAGSSDNLAEGIPQDKTLKWRIMSINEDATIDIVSAAPITTSVFFNGALGYNNGVLLLNDLCKTQYSNSDLGVTARSINVEDIESKFNTAGINARNTYVAPSSNIQYGSTKTYSGSNSYSPDIYDKVGKTTEEESEDYYTEPTAATHSQKGTLEVQQTYYNISGSSSYIDNAEFYKLVFGTGTAYWLASRYSICNSTDADFGLRFVDSANLGGRYLFLSNRGTSNDDCRVRPVVTLGSNIKISSEGGTEANPRTISK